MLFFDRLTGPERACFCEAKIRMCQFPAPAGRPEMLHKNFMHRHLRIFEVQCTHA